MVAHAAIHFHLWSGGGEGLLLAGERLMRSTGPLDVPVAVPVAIVACRCSRNTLHALKRHG